MGGFLKQSTAAQSRALGPFLDDTDFKTAKTALTIANTDIKLVANGAASVNKTSGGGTHRVNGVYSVTFDATDTATVGELEVSVVVAGALPVFDKFTVVTPTVYDALLAASALGYLQASGNLAGSVGSVLGSVGSVAPGGVTADAFAADAVDELWDELIGDGTLTARQAMRVMLSALAGKLSGALSTTVTTRNVADTADVIAASVDADGNRLSTTVTP